ncbi:aspartyl/glutamyl-tRNA amidotransferase subunit A [Pacificimonas flava]|uniref:Glutamyl-tRNA(Gln) amidotransferase subunit A n=2 Tax=Pacificimonas TaxID=1960290 RepID=A0A219B5L6_9SPHN|nr:MULTISPECIES: Asp-tRNA(Asn)/Glu-tRNA(Gln) amidotransferase subunit GatA [Pacificimonas]MBZ6379108.1 Asp-tRNA(Asn)/Glu-tRNA(Gln) amidotransferase subunit GatA [Pacificimonas aurantium]OWV33660.1 aspartyl/glutamyl-tRNA amidotransferase subunit A [Pacificimonas flava]
MSELTGLSLAEMRAGLKAKQFSAAELAAAHNSAVEAGRELNAYTVETPELALAAAEAADRAIAGGEELKPLAGIPLGIKDLFCTEGVESTAGSNILRGFHPQYESTVSAKLKAAGAGMLGKLNMDEFAMGSSNETSAWGNVVNPWRGKGNEALVPGGSSGGSSSAVAAKLCAGATGTDTGGSIRQPAAFTGICGIKPTYGRCSRWGIVSFASSLDQAGPMARTVTDCAILLGEMAGFDPKDSTSLDLPVPDFEAALTGDLQGKRVGIPKEYTIEGIPAEIADLWSRGAEMLKDAGAEIVEVSLPHTKYALPTYYIIAPAEASSNLARYDGVRYGLREAPEGGNLIDMYEATRSAGFGDEVKRRIMIGTYVLSAGYYDAYYLKAQKVRTLIQRDFDNAWADCDLLLAPTAPSAAFAAGDKLDDPIAMYLNDVFCVPASLAGLPAMSVPAGLNADGLPLGLQLIGKALDEEGVLNAGFALERAAGFAAQPEKWW